MRYRIALHQSEEGFAVSMPGLPGCWLQGATEAEAIDDIKDAIRQSTARNGGPPISADKRLVAIARYLQRVLILL